MSDELNHNRELILQEERDFARAVAVRVIDKPKPSFWLVVLPILFLYYAYQIRKYKKSLAAFVEDFLLSRRRAMELAWELATTGSMPGVETIDGVATLNPALRPPYCAWLVALAQYYDHLLRQSGASFPALARAGYRSRADLLLVQNRLNSLEREFYSVLGPEMAAVEGASEIIAKVERASRDLRREAAERIFL